MRKISWILTPANMNDSPIYFIKHDMHDAHHTMTTYLQKEKKTAELAENL